MHNKISSSSTSSRVLSISLRNYTALLLPFYNTPYANYRVGAMNHLGLPV